MSLFQGLCAFPITPADADGRVDRDALARLMARLSEAGVDSVGLLGSTGSYLYLSREERRRAIEAARGVDRRMPLLVGVGALRTDAAQALARDAQEAGADALLLAPVSYAPLTDEEVFRHVTAVAGCTALPLCVYNNPSTTHFSVSDALLARLAQTPRIVAVKNPAPPASEASQAIASLRRLVGESFSIGYSGDWVAPDAVLSGGQAWYSVVGGLLPRPALALMRAAQAGDVAAVRSIDASFAPLWDLFRQYGSYRVVHAAANLMGLTQAQPPLPVQPLGQAERAQIAEALERLEG